jgi:hypothetical protein
VVADGSTLPESREQGMKKTPDTFYLFLYFFPASASSRLKSGSITIRPAFYRPARIRSVSRRIFFVAPGPTDNRQR